MSRFAAVPLVLLVAACSAKHVSNTLSCGPGTTQRGDVCLPADTTGRLVCGTGTHEVALACVPDAPTVSCGAGTERQGSECTALDATLYDLRLPTYELPADGYSKIPVFAIGRRADGTPSSESVSFGLSRPDAGAFVATSATLTPMGVVAYFVPCSSALTPSCAGVFTATLALASAPATLLARTVEAILVDPSGVGSAAPCQLGGDVLHLAGEAGDPIHPDIDTITLGDFTVTHLGGGTPTRVEIRVEPTAAAQGTLWTTVFSSEDLDATLQAQVYDQAQRVDYTAPGHPGLEVVSATATCNTLAGRFQVHELVLAGDTTLQSFTATFEQHCDGDSSTPALRGCVHVAP